MTTVKNALYYYNESVKTLKNNFNLQSPRGVLTKLLKKILRSFLRQGCLVLTRLTWQDLFTISVRHHIQNFSHQMLSVLWIWPQDITFIPPVKTHCENRRFKSHVWMDLNNLVYFSNISSLFLSQCHSMTFQGRKIDFFSCCELRSLIKWYLEPGKPYWRGNLSTVDLLVLTSLDRLPFTKKILITFVRKQAKLMRRSTVLSFPL